MKAWDISENTDVSWIFAKTGHHGGPMDGVGGCIKKVVKDTSLYNPDGAYIIYVIYINLCNPKRLTY